MIREIKFRAWDGKKMFSASEMGRDELQINPDGRGFFNANPTSPRLSEYYSHMIPLQYTGLYDRDGNEVYEGDILLNFDRSVDGNKGEYMSAIQALVDALERISTGELPYHDAIKLATQALDDYDKSQKEDKCDAMGHYGADKTDGICPKCNKSW